MAVAFWAGDAQSADQAIDHVPTDQAGFQEYMRQQVARRVPGDTIVFEAGYLMKIISPVTKQWVALPLDSVHDGCVAHPDGCDAAVAAYVVDLDKMLPAAIAARDKRQAHDNSLQMLTTENPAPTQILPPAAPAADGSIPSDKDAFTKLYAEALAKALPDLQIAVSGPLRVTIHVPNLGSHIDELDDIYGLCERHKFNCGDGLSEWLTLDTSNIVRQLDAARGNAH